MKNFKRPDKSKAKRSELLQTISKEAKKPVRTSYCDCGVGSS